MKHRDEDTQAFMTSAAGASLELALPDTAADAITERLRTSDRPVRLTRRGREIGVVLETEKYERLQQTADRARLAEAVREAERDVAAGRVVAHEEMKRRWLPVDGQS